MQFTSLANLIWAAHVCCIHQQLYINVHIGGSCMPHTSEAIHQSSCIRSCMLHTSVTIHQISCMQLMYAHVCSIHEAIHAMYSMYRRIFRWIGDSDYVPWLHWQACSSPCCPDFLDVGNPPVATLVSTMASQVSSLVMTIGRFLTNRTTYGHQWSIGDAIGDIGGTNALTFRCWGWTGGG